MLLDFQALIKKYSLKITGVIHIGAHHGQELDEYAKVESIEDIILFEPDPDSYAVLKKHEAENIFCENVALGSKRGRLSFYRSTGNKGMSNSLLEPALHATQYPDIVFDKVIEVDVLPLDSYRLTLRYNFINIDVQGYELEVFKGAVQTLPQIDYIMTEVNNSELYKNCALVGQVDEFLAGYGFKRVETVWAGVTWGDALYVKGA